MGQILQRMLDALYSKKLEVVLVGLENSGKTTLLNVLAKGHPVETCPTIGLNVKLVRKGGVQMKCWDIGGQAQSSSAREAASGAPSTGSTPAVAARLAAAVETPLAVPGGC